MAEIRFHPFIKDWVMIASHRQERPQMPQNWCPFCPGSGKVPQDYDVFKYDNDFPALSQTPPEPDVAADGFFDVRPAYGKCEVILYSKDHNTTLCELPVGHIKKLVDLWVQRNQEIAADEKIKYIFIFENKGEVVGVTMPHPHGQIYGYPSIPKKLELELAAHQEHAAKTGECLFCDWRRNELEDGRRVIFQNSAFSVILPFFTEYPYGMYIIANRHFGQISEMTEPEKLLFAETVKNVTGTLDSLFDSRFPYMMCMHQAPVNPVQDFHFHVEFFPPMRSATKQKFNASSETGAWAHCNPTCPEEKAQELRQAYARFQNKQIL